MSATNFKLPFLIVVLNKESYAISCALVREIVRLPVVTTVPNTPAQIRGVINLRGNVVPIIDLRVQLGMSSYHDDIEAMMELLSAREQDHVRWLKELEASIREKRPFTLARDPTKCAFGKWYYNYHSNDYMLQALLAKFDAPHRRIHQIADAVCQFADQAQYDQAFGIIEATRNGDLGTMIRLFEQTRHLYRLQARELALIVERGPQRKALTIDAVDSVEKLDEKTVNPVLPGLPGIQPEFILGTARRKKGDRVVLLLDVERLFSANTAGTLAA